MVTRTFRGFPYTVQTASGNSQTLQGTPGNDWIEALGGNNHIRTGKGNDVIIVGVAFGEIRDYPPYGGQAIFYDPLPASIQIGNNKIDAGAGDDFVITGTGDDFVNLGNGNNVFDGGAGGNDRVFAGNGNDIIDISGYGNHFVDAGGGHNRIYLAAGNAEICAGSGNDVVTITPTVGVPELLSYLQQGGTPYTQKMDLGNGNNQLVLTMFGQTHVNTGSGKDFVLLDSVIARLAGIVNEDSVKICTGSGDDTVVTIGTRSLIRTESGDDVIFAGAGDDTIEAGSGRNVINLRGGTVTLPDPVNQFSPFRRPSVEVQGGGKDTVHLGSGRDTVVLGSGGFATIYGFGRHDRLDVSGLNASFSCQGGNTWITAGGQAIGVLKGYTGSVGLV
ncbi:MAG: calcium-binding protein [Synechococcales bacterium]|nr:calcium-binding protein [Synechococcales bacterium]